MNRTAAKNILVLVLLAVGLAIFALKQTPPPPAPSEIKATEFSGNDTLTAYSIPRGVKKIGERAFAFCENLETIDIPTSVKIIESSAFVGCINLKTVNYLGSKEEWERLFNSPDFSRLQNEDLLNAKVICLDGDYAASMDLIVAPRQGEMVVKDYEFARRVDLRMVRILDGFEIIGEGAFAESPNIETVEIPSGVKKIGSLAFASCPKIETVAIPKSVEQIGSGVFGGNSNLKEIRYGGTKKEWEAMWTQNRISKAMNENLFFATVVCSDGVYETPSTLVVKPEFGKKTIGDYEYSSRIDMKKVTLAKGFKAIGRAAFANCRFLEEVEFEKGIKAIPDSAFAGTNLLSLKLPEGVTEIGEDAFMNNSNLETVELPKSLKRVGDFAFGRCPKLKAVKFGGTQEEWSKLCGSKNFGYYNGNLLGAKVECSDGVYEAKTELSLVPQNGATTIEEKQFAHRVDLKAVKISGGFTSVKRGAFSECVNLKTLEASVTHVGKEAFSHNTNLETVVFDEGLLTIGETAFSSCTNLTTITLPSSVKKISFSAFSMCPKLETVKFLGTAEEWAQIKIEYDNDALVNANLEFLGTQTAASKFGPRQKRNDWPRSVTIAHALGGIDSLAYTNSLEAFEASYRKGHRTFEVDLAVTLDSELVCLRHWNEAKKQGITEKSSLSREDFLSRKFAGKYTTLSLQHLFELMKKHQDVWLVTDTKGKTKREVERDFGILLATAQELGAEEILPRLVVQFYNEEMFETIEKVYPFENYIFTLYQLWRDKKPETFRKYAEFCRENDVPVITMWDYLATEKILEIARANGIAVYVHTVNDLARAKELQKLGVKGFYTDFLTPKDFG